MKIKSIWIIGGGRFGRKAAEKLTKRKPVSDITVVEKDTTTCNQLTWLPVKSVCMDGIDYLTENLKSPDTLDWIVPAVPMHVAYEWIKRRLSEKYQLNVLAVPDELTLSLPNPHRGIKGELYVSNADFLCPEDCPEPEKICTYTGEPRPRILHEVLGNIRYGDCLSVVIQSRQLCPGVGGYSPKALFNAANEIVEAGAPILLSTACRCHGVMHAFELHRRAHSPSP